MVLEPYTLQRVSLLFFTIRRRYKIGIWLSVIGAFIDLFPTLESLSDPLLMCISSMKQTDLH